MRYKNQEGKLRGVILRHGRGFYKNYRNVRTIYDSKVVGGVP